MQVAVIGAGYVGLATAVGLSSLGHDVAVGERSAERVEMLRSGRSPIFEPELLAMLRVGSEAGRLSFHTSNVDAAA
ncbi:MAG TPA: UDP-glucose 6-dehydrogenase, partial [Actinobacteria bacterium]|nr:UDP-glucose 6-dehydrogenase [Actinomycetota bacterium]